ncbi:hypothetical protein P691DRAFT_810282 [Macrolepiota fuliginosa MF-IS2]|uniref:Arrestin-like N-terminal domain-containing protein n=1 Tax=Macrolepiota fuliginosa MF-IS2 TaxID=1400762 RepID=A0A9P5XGU5_9AGAR|nr:hypothetical protein P691DRAFT_810282 [Macrolepiota fuliginosa MF-IS2]
MNTTASHAKIRVGVTLPKESVVAGGFVTGKMEVESKSDKLALGIVMVELFGFQELTSRDHSARMTFLHTRRLFQGPGLPPSNAVYAYPLPEDPPFPEDYYKAKRGHSTFLFRIPLPISSPASIDFAGGLARVRYEVRASIGIFWKGDKVVVVDKSDVGVVESFQEDLFGAGRAEEGVVVVGEAGRFWMHGRVVGGMLVAGESACVELQVKNHSSRKNTGLTLSLHRTLLLPNTNPNANPNANPLQISDTILTVPYKGPEYILPPGGEGVAHLVFDVPINARTVRGGTYKDGADGGRRTSEALFCVQANVEVKVNMGLGSKDIVLDVPVTIVHPDALPDVPLPQPQIQPQAEAQPERMVYPQYAAAPPSGVPGPYSQPYIDPQTHQVWIPHPQQSPYHPYYPMHTTEGYYPQQQQFYPHPHAHIPQPAAYTNVLNLLPPRQLPPRPSSAGPLTTSPSHVPASGYEPPISGLPIPMESVHMVHHVPLLPLPVSLSRQQSTTTPPRNNHYHQTQNASVSPHSPTTPHHNHQHQHQHEDISPQALGMGASPSQVQLPGEREEGKGVVAMRISRHLRQSSTVNGRGRSVSPVAHRFGYPGVPVPMDTGGSGEDSDEPPAAVGAQDIPTTPERADAQTETLLHSPRPQIKHKQSFTKVDGDGRVVVKSERVLELEKIAAGLDGSSLGGDGLLQGSLGRVGRDGGKDKEETDANVNKTLPIPPPATKSRKRFGGRENGVGPPPTLESLFEPPHPNATATMNSPTAFANASAAPTTSITNLPSPLQSPAKNYQTPPTPTLVAFKRPPRLGLEKSGGGGGENGLDALERRLVAQVGTRKVERARPADVRDVLPGGVIGSAGGEPAASVKNVTTPNHDTNPDVAGTGTGTRRSASASISASSELERMQDANDESAISSLTLDRSSSVSEDAQKERQRDGEKEMEREREMNEAREREDEEQEQEQESVDGGKTHRAGKSVVGVESYFQGRNNHRRERVGIEPIDTARTVVHANTTATTPNVTSKKKAAASADKSNKSAKARGRVAAWLGNIDPGVPPPQEEIIPPSPSVVRPPDLDGEREENKEDSPIPPPAPVQVLLMKESERQPLELQSPTVAAAATPSSSPNPRSSGFMPIGTIHAQRDTITDSMTRSMIRRVGAVTGREMTVVREARKVMDLWSEELPPTPPSAVRSDENGKEKEKEERKVSQWPFMTHIPPKAQTIRTDRRVSPPSVSATAGAPGALTVGMATSKPSEPEPGPRPWAVIAAAPPTLAPDVKAGSKPQPKEYPKSYANAAKKNPSPRLPAFPPPPRQESEVKYDIRSARGGRGGKVTHVASLWASVAAGNVAGAGPSVVKPSESRYAPPSASVDVRKAGAPLLLPKKPTPSVLPHITTATSTAVPQARPVPQSKTPTPTSDTKARRKATTPTPPPKPPSSSKPMMVTTAGQTKPKPQRPELPPSIPAPTPTPASRPTPNLARKPQMKGTPMPAPMTKSPSVPALVSSSLATPMLSSTASLVRPVGSSVSKTYTVAVGMPGIGRGDYKSGGGSGGRSGGGVVSGGTRGGVVRKKSGLGMGEEGGSRARPLAKERNGPTSARAVVNGASGGVKTGAETTTVHGEGGEGDPKQLPPRNTAFGQARLRDLIKKYQGGNA